MLTQQAGAAPLTVSWLREQLLQVSEVPVERWGGEELREAGRVSGAGAAQEGCCGLFPASSRMRFERFLILITPFAVNESLQILEAWLSNASCRAQPSAPLTARMSHSHFSRRHDLQGCRRDPYGSQPHCNAADAPLLPGSIPALSGTFKLPPLNIQTECPAVSCSPGTMIPHFQGEELEHSSALPVPGELLLPKDHQGPSWQSPEKLAGMQSE